MAVELRDEQQRALELIYTPFREGGVWPEYQWVDKTLYRELDVDAREFLPTFPIGLIYPEPGFGNFYLRTDQEVALTVAGVALCEGSEEDVRIFVEALRLFVRLEAEYLPPPTGGQSLEAGSHELQRDLSFSDDQVARVYQLFHTELGLLGSGGGQPTNWRFQLTPDLRRFAGVETIDDYLARRIVPRRHNRPLEPVVLEADTSGAADYVGASGRNYWVVESLLSGGFGAVVRVRDESGDEFALKTLKVELEDQDALMHEVENLASVQHENVIRYIDYGVAPEPFLVMELAHDGSLRARLETSRQQGTPIPIETMLAWATQMLSGLAAIHDVLIHRDLKPDNVLFEGETLKIGDFGIARVLDASTRIHTFKGWGTPVYLPPEGWAGPEGPSPAPTYDLYSFGVMLFELVTLRPPFEGDRSALAQAHLYQVPPAPSSIRSDIPPQLEALILRLLQKDPAQRGGDAPSVLQAIHQIRINLRAEVGQAADAPASPTLERLRRGASTLIQQQSEEEARRRAQAAAKRSVGETFTAGLDALARLIDEAAAIVDANVTPLHVDGRRADRGTWVFGIPPSPLQLRISVSQANSQEFPSDMRPGEILGFGEIQVVSPDQLRGGGRVSADPRAGANIVMYVRPDTAWVPHLQFLELENSPIVARRMRAFDPFFLERSELAEHGRWLWGGAMHVFQSRAYEVTVDALVEWISRLMP